MTADGKVSRREFAKGAAAGLVAPRFVPAAALGLEGKTAANSRIHLGLIGCGNMGRVNLENCCRYDDVVLTAACDVWKERLDRVVSRHRESCTPYRDYREMLGRADVDAVIIASPRHWHALHAVDACRAGKDIYLQKPMTLHLGESLAVRNAVRKHGVISQIGTQIHAGSNYRRVVEYVRSGRLGPIATVRCFMVMNQGREGIGHADSPADPRQLGWNLDWDFWCGPAPKLPFNMLMVQDSYHRGSWMEYGGGWTAGMAPHIVDLPVWALDMGFPTAVSSAGARYIVRDDGNAYDNHQVLWQYPDRTMSWSMSLTNSYGFELQGKPGIRRRLGVYFHGLNATLYSDYRRHEVVPEGDRMKDAEPPPRSIPPSPGQEREWLDCVRSRREPSCSALYHVHVDVPIVLSVLSYRLGRSIRFDPEKERIVGDGEAAARAVPRYRDPWKFPREYLNEPA